MEMAVPIVRVLAHELGEDRNTRDGIQGNTRFLDVQAGRDVDVEGRGLGRLWHIGLTSCEGRQGCICAVEREGARVVDWNVDLDRIIEAGLQSGARLASRIPNECIYVTHLYSLNFLRSNSSFLPGIFTHKLPWRHIELMPSISNRTL